MHTIKNWLPMIAGMFCLGLGPGIMAIYGFFVEPLAREFAVGAAVINIGPVALLLVPGIVAPLVGKIADRSPTRRLVLIGSSVAMLSLLGISQAPSLWLAGLGFLGFSLGITLYGPVVINGLLVRAYPGREARALAVAAMGISVASAVLPPAMGVLLLELDWRGALATLATVLLLLLWVTALVGVPAGKTGVVVERQGPADSAIYRQSTFWLIGFCVALGLNVMLVLAVVFAPHFAQRGFSVAEAGWFIALAGVAGLCGKTCLALWGDALRRYAKWLVVALLLLQALGLYLLLQATSANGVLVALVLQGFGSGAFIPMHPYLNSRYFDAAVISEVNGAQMPLFLPFGLVGAPLAGYVYDRSGSYDMVLAGLVGVLLVAATIALCLPAPRRSTTAAGLAIPDG